MPLVDPSAPGHRGRADGGRGAGPGRLLAELLEVPVEQIDAAVRRAGRVLRGRGARLRCWPRIAGGFRIPDPPRPGPLRRALRHRGPSSRLSAAALETLAIVAYKQPVSRAQIAALRGVNVDGVVRLLEHRGYIAAVGRDPGPGRPSSTAPPTPFLERLGLDSTGPAAAGRGPPARARGPGRVGGSDAPGRRWLTVRTVSAPPLPTGDRLQKVLARIGVGSRRVCEELIVDGRVTVNGRSPVLGRRVDPDRGPGGVGRGSAAGRAPAWSTTW